MRVVVHNISVSQLQIVERHAVLSFEERPGVPSAFMQLYELPWWYPAADTI